MGIYTKLKPDWRGHSGRNWSRTKDRLVEGVHCSCCSLVLSGWNPRKGPATVIFRVLKKLPVPHRDIYRPSLTVVLDSTVPGYRGRGVRQNKNKTQLKSKNLISKNEFSTKRRLLVNFEICRPTEVFKDVGLSN